MREEQLRKVWEEADVAKGARSLSHAALVELTVCHNHGGPSPGTGFIVIEIGENLAYNWQSGSLIAFWADGEHTCLDGLEFEVIIPDLWG